MKKSRTEVNVSLLGQFQRLAKEVQLATEAHAELNASMRKTQALLERSGQLTEKLVAETARIVDQASLSTALKKELVLLKTALRAFSVQYLKLQTQMQNENRAYTLISNVLKSKHDTVKNTIGNIK